MNKKPPNARIVLLLPDREFCLMTPHNGLYQVGGRLLFPSRDGLIRILQNLGAVIEGDDVWL